MNVRREALEHLWRAVSKTTARKRKIAVTAWMRDWVHEAAVATTVDAWMFLGRDRDQLSSALAHQRREALTALGRKVAEDSATVEERRCTVRDTIEHRYTLAVLGPRPANVATGSWR